MNIIKFSGTAKHASVFRVKILAKHSLYFPIIRNGPTIRRY